MGTTRAITDDRNVWVTTFFGGQDRGRCFDFVMVRNGRKLVAQLTEEDFWKLLSARGALIEDDGIRPEMI